MIDPLPPRFASVPIVCFSVGLNDFYFQLWKDTFHSAVDENDQSVILYDKMASAAGGGNVLKAMFSMCGNSTSAGTSGTTG